MHDHLKPFMIKYKFEICALCAILWMNRVHFVSQTPLACRVAVHTHLHIHMTILIAYWVTFFPILLPKRSTRTTGAAMASAM